MKNSSHRYDINRPRFRHGHKYSTYKKNLTMMILICIKQHLRNTWRSVHTTLRLSLKSVAYKKSVYFRTGEISAFYIFVTNSINCIGMLIIVALLLYNFRKICIQPDFQTHPLQVSALLNSNSKLYLKLALKILENFRWKTLQSSSFS